VWLVENVLVLKMSNFKKYFNRLNERFTFIILAERCQKLITPTVNTNVKSDTDFHTHLQKLKENDPKVINLTFERKLGSENLKKLNEALKNNTFVGMCQWHRDQANHQSMRDEIEEKLKKNIFEFRRHPSDLKHALLSYHVYHASLNQEGQSIFFKEDVFERKFIDWEIERIFDKLKTSGYLSVLYTNHTTKQMVLAHKGTENLKDIFTDIDSVVQKKITSQMKDCYKATREAVKLAHETGYQLSITGHSLGGWLAEMSLYYCHEDFEFPNVKAVTFDSPGSGDQFEVLQSNIINFRSKQNLYKYDICSYLAEPNLVNTSNSHIGSKILKIGCKHESSPLKSNKNEILSLKKEHSIENFINAFDLESERLKDFVLIRDWPRLVINDLNQSGFIFLQRNTYEALKFFLIRIFTLLFRYSKSFSLFGENTQVNSSESESGIWDKLHDSVLLTAKGLSLAYKFFNGNFNEDQLINFKRSKSDDNEFNLKYRSKYAEFDTFDGVKTDMLNLDYTGGPDTYLYQLYSLNLDRIRHEHHHELYLIRILKELKRMYDIEEKNSSKLITCKDDLKSIDDLREIMSRCIQIADNQLNFLFKTPQNELDYKQIRSNLPTFELANFIGRETNLKQLEALSNDRICVIYGYKGSGKTTLARKYAQDILKNANNIVIWFNNANSIESVYKQYSDIIEFDLEIKVSQKFKGSDLARIIKNNIKPSMQYALVFDNAEEWSWLKVYFENLPDNVKVILTTANEEIVKENISNLIKNKVESFDLQEAVDFLRKTLSEKLLKKYDQNELESFLMSMCSIPGDKFEISPYKLEKITTIINNDEYTLDECRKSIKLDQIEDYLFKKLIDENKLTAIELLKLCSFLNPELIPKAFLEFFFENRERELNEAIKCLREQTLIETFFDKSDELNVKIHSLAFEAIKRTMREINRDEILNQILHRINEKLKIEVHDYTDKTKKSKILQINTQLESVFSNLEMDLMPDKTSLNVADLFEKKAFIDKFYFSLNKKALEYHLKALAMRKKIFKNRDHFSIAKSLNSVGTSYGSKGDYKNELKYHLEALEMNKRLYGNGRDNSNIANSLNNLGVAYGHNGDHVKELKCHLDSFKMRQRLFENQDKFDIANSLNNVGVAYGRNGDYKKELEYELESLAMRKRLFKDTDHVHIARALSSVGTAYEHNGEFKKELEVHLQALEMRKRIFENKNHFDIAKSLNNVGNAYKNNGDYKKELQYRLESLEMSIEILGSIDHPKIVGLLNDIGAAYGRNNDADNQVKYELKAVEMRKILNI
jgi:hypothetical protein